MHRRILIFVAMVTFPPMIYIGFSVRLNMHTQSNVNYASSALLAAPPAPLASAVTLKIATINVAAVQNSSDTRARRLEAIAEALAGLDPDIVAIQEAYMDQERNALLGALEGSALQYHEYFPSATFGSGLLTLSKHPLKESFFHRFTKNGKWYKLHHGDWWAGRGVALSRIELPDGTGYVDFYNVHTVARHGSTEYDDQRAIQMREVAEFVGASGLPTAPVLVAGDLNCKKGAPEYAPLAEGAGFLSLSRDEGTTHILSRTRDMYTVEVSETREIDSVKGKDGETFSLKGHPLMVSTLVITPVS